MLDICKYGDEILREKCSDVTVFDDALAILADAMFDTLEEAEGVGLAGPQVGVNSNLFIVLLPDDGIREVFINPQIAETSVETCPYNEGCLSLPGVYRDIERPKEVTVFYQDLSGKRRNIHADGLYARVIQHEFDHLSGKLFIDHLPPEEREKTVALYQKKARGRRRFSGK